MEEALIKVLISMMRGFTTLSFEIRKVDIPGMATDVLQACVPAYAVFGDKYQHGSEALEGLIFQFTHNGQVRWYKLPEKVQGQHDAEGWEFAQTLKDMMHRYNEMFNVSTGGRVRTRADVAEVLKAKPKKDKCRKLIDEARGFIDIQRRFVALDQHGYADKLNSDIDASLDDLENAVETL